MKVLMYDPFAGISGDMHIGAMVDLGVPLEYIEDALSSLHVAGWSLECIRDQRKGITGTRAHVHLNHDDTHHHEHHHKQGEATQSLHHHHHDHVHRNYADIRHIIESSHLNTRVQELSLKMFKAVAEAEAKIHGKPVDEVHFHEVGAVDSIVDIIAAAVALDYFKPDRIISTYPELGGGFVACAHGKMPVPAPATIEILKGIPTRSGAVMKEMTTPTGAAILTSVVDEFVSSYDMSIAKIGYGVGMRDTEIPNVLRVCLGETVERRNRDEVLMIETNIDDMSPEFYPYIIGRLFSAGAKEAYITPIIMKKGRPGALLTVMTVSALSDAIYEIIFMETTTAGVREYAVRQTMLKRDFRELETPYGKIMVKDLQYKGRVISSKPEYDRIAEIAEREKIPLRSIYGKMDL